MSRWTILCLLLLAPDTPLPPAAQRAALSAWQPLVGAWRGVGQPRRGSTKDAWTEECEWSWSFSNQRAALVMHSPSGKFFRSAALQATTTEGQMELVVKTPAGLSVTYASQPPEAGSLVFLTEKLPEHAPPDLPSRISLRFVAGGDRLLMLYERKSDADRYTRLAEVGLTRKGSDFGKTASYVECVVTGGVGTIAVMHQGKTYYVCCTGCRDYFQDHPEEVLAEYRARKTAKKK